MMFQSSKVHGEKSNDTDHLEGKDWFSNLPDGILCHILSFTCTRDAVRTGILSTRWKSLWTLVPVIDFSNYGELSRKGDSPGSFMDVVARVLHNSRKLNKFILRGGIGTEFRLNSWISTAIKGHVQELDIDIRTQSIVELPRDLFTSIDLVVLKLLYCHLFCRSPSTLFFLPRLKVLHFYSLDFLDNDSLKSLLSGCPVLEELVILPSAGKKITTFYICSSTLKKLIVHIHYKEGSDHFGLVIKAPSLESLDLHGTLLRDFEAEELPALVKAKFHVWCDDYEGSDCYCNVAVQMLAKASNVRHLELANSTVNVAIRASTYNELLFHSLTHLDIGITDIPSSVVLDLLGCIPSLKVLVLKKDHFKCWNSCLWSGVPGNVPTCLSLNLEKIGFHGFYGCNKEMKLVQYLLENTMVLKKLSLHCRSRNEEIWTGLQKYKRGSSTCQIEFCYQFS